MKLKGVEPLNTVIKLPDGRIGTICYNWLDGCGGIWGKKHFDTAEFMLREKEIEGKLRGLENAECVGEEYEILL